MAAWLDLVVRARLGKPKFLFAVPPFQPFTFSFFITFIVNLCIMIDCICCRVKINFELKTIEIYLKSRSATHCVDLFHLKNLIVRGFKLI